MKLYALLSSIPQLPVIEKEVKPRSLNLISLAYSVCYGDLIHKSMINVHLDHELEV